jgi:hypothetical protein
MSTDPSPDTPDGTGPPPLRLDLGDFDAIGVATELVVTLRAHAIQHDTDAAATVSAPDGWHHLVITARRSGHVVLGIRYSDLTRSRVHNLSRALHQREWDLDEDDDGVTRRYPPGTEASTAAFEILTVLTLAGAPTGTREVTAVDGTGQPIDLVPPAG